MGKKSKRNGGGNNCSGASGARARPKSNHGTVRNAPPPESSKPPMIDFDKTMSGMMAALTGMGGEAGCAETDWKGLPAQELFLAAKHHDAERMQELLEDAAMRARVNDEDGDGCGILHNMALMGRSSDAAVEILNLLVENGYDVDMKNRMQETALQIATIYSRHQLVQAFLDCGARCDLVDWKGDGPVGTAREKCTHAGSGEEDCCITFRIIQEANGEIQLDTARAAKADDLRRKGNQEFQSRNYRKARDYYTESLNVLEDHRTYSNRAMCGIKIGREIFEEDGEFEQLPNGTYRTFYPEAIRKWGEEASADAGKAIRIEPDSEKAYHRQVLGYCMQRDFPRAKSHCRDALKTCPDSDSLKEAMQFLERLHTPNHISNPFAQKPKVLEADRLVDEGRCEVIACSYCFKKQPFVKDPFCVACAMDMSRYEPGTFAPMIVKFIMGYK